MTLSEYLSIPILSSLHRYPLHTCTLLVTLLYLLCDQDYPTAKKLLLATLKLVDACKERLFTATSVSISKKLSMGHEVVVEEEEDDEQDVGQNSTFGVGNNRNNLSLVNPTPISPTGGLTTGSGSTMQQQLSTELSMELPTYDLLHNQDAYEGPGMPHHTHISYTSITYPFNTPL